MTPPLWQKAKKTLKSPLDCKEIQPVHPKWDQSWVFIGRTDVEAETPILLATWCEELTHLKRPWCWERLRAGGEGDNRGWDGWMALVDMSLDSGSWWWTGRPGVLWFMGLQRVRHDWATELNWTELNLVKTQMKIQQLQGVAWESDFPIGFHGEGNGNPLQYSCLETPMDRRAWWAAVHRVAQSRTWLTWLSSSSSTGSQARTLRDRVWVALCPPVVTSHVWPLSIWNVTLLNWDTLEV